MMKSGYLPIFLIVITAALNAQQSVQYRYLASWGEPGTEAGQMREPGGMSIDPWGFIYIADTGNHRIQKLDSHGIFITEIGGFGWESGQFDHPLNLYAGNGLDVMVADYNNDRIQRFDKDLNYLSSYRSSEDDPEQLQFALPLDLDLSSQGELYCLDGFNRRILKFDTQGRPQISFGDFDAGKGRLNSPRHMLIFNSQRIFISDMHPARIVVFDIHGNYLNSFGEKQLMDPQDLCTIGKTQIAVADAGLQDVLWFDVETGELLTVLSKMQSGLIKLNEPVSVVSYKKRLYVLDKKSALIHLYERLLISGSAH